MRSTDVMTAERVRETSAPPVRAARDTSVLLVSRRHVDLGRLASALCS